MFYPLDRHLTKWTRTWNSRPRTFVSAILISVIFAMAANRLTNLKCDENAWSGIKWSRYKLITYLFSYLLPFSPKAYLDLEFILIDSEVQSWLDPGASNLRPEVEKRGRTPRQGCPAKRVGVTSSRISLYVIKN